MCTLRAQSAVELEPDMQHITLKSHLSGFSTCSISSSIRLGVAVGRATTKHQWTRHQVVRIVFKEVVQMNFMAHTQGLSHGGKSLCTHAKRGNEPRDEGR